MAVFRMVNTFVFSIFEIHNSEKISLKKARRKKYNKRAVKISFFSLFESCIIILTVFRKSSSAEPNSDHRCGEGVWPSQLSELHSHHCCSHQSRPRHQVNGEPTDLYMT
jgi:hypothetical protein